jgi:hypothetical protein
MYKNETQKERRENSISVQNVELCLSSRPIERDTPLHMWVHITLTHAARTALLRCPRISLHVTEQNRSKYLFFVSNLNRRCRKLRGLIFCSYPLKFLNCKANAHIQWKVCIISLCSWPKMMDFYMSMPITLEQCVPTPRVKWR